METIQQILLMPIIFMSSSDTCMLHIVTPLFLLATKDQSTHTHTVTETETTVCFQLVRDVSISPTYTR